MNVCSHLERGYNRGTAKDGWISQIISQLESQKLDGRGQRFMCTTGLLSPDPFWEVALNCAHIAEGPFL